MADTHKCVLTRNAARESESLRSPRLSVSSEVSWNGCLIIHCRRKTLFLVLREKYSNGFSKK